MSKTELSQYYKTQLGYLKSKLAETGLRDEQIHKIILENIDSQKETTKYDNKKNVVSKSRHIVKIVFFTFIVYLVSIMILHKPFSILICKIQDFIYPALRILRVISIPVLELFPRLSGLYDESCLLQNPYFYVNDLSCWVCKDVNRIQEYDMINEEINVMPPFIFKTNQNEITTKHLIDLYESNAKIFDTDASRVLGNGSKYILPEEFFHNYLKSNEKYSSSSYLWKLTRLKSIQLVKTLFPRPDVIPQQGLSIERYISIDEPNSAAYSLPDTECNYVFVIQSQGERLVELKPANKCTKECNSIFIKLRPSYMLWYNWWYWKPVSQKVLNNITSVSYIASYC